jgi:endonuclease YncB( thermonuclease family)
MRATAFLLIALAGLILFNFQAHAKAKISYFYDGDTVKIIQDKSEYKLRITYIDAPERNQTYGLKSRRALMQLCQHAKVEVSITGTDKYHRKLGSLYCNKQNVAEYMLKNGHAWFNNHYSTDLTLALKEKHARDHQLGLWQDKRPIAPWIWRQRNKAQQPKTSSK